MKRSLDAANAEAREIVADADDAASHSTDDDPMPGLVLPRTEESRRFFEILHLMHDRMRFDLLDEFNALGLALGGPLNWRTIEARSSRSGSMAAALKLLLQKQDVHEFGELLLKVGDFKNYLFNNAEHVHMVGATFSLANTQRLMEDHGSLLHQIAPSHAVYDQFILALFTGIVAFNKEATVEEKIQLVLSPSMKKNVKLSKERYRALLEVAFIRTPHYLQWYQGAGVPPTDDEMRQALEIEKFSNHATDLYRLYSPRLEPLMRFTFILSYLSYRPMDKFVQLLRATGLALTFQNSHDIDATLIEVTRQNVVLTGVYEALNEWDATYFSFDNMWRTLAPHLLQRANGDSAAEFITALNLSGGGDERTIRDIASDVVQGGHSFFLEKFFSREPEGDEEIKLRDFDKWIDGLRFDQMLLQGANVSRNDTFGCLLEVFYFAHPEFDNDDDRMKAWAKILTKVGSADGIWFILIQPQSFIEFDDTLLSYYWDEMVMIFTFNPALFIELDFLPHFLAKHIVSVDMSAKITDWLTRTAARDPTLGLAKYLAMLKGESSNQRVDARNLLAQIGFWAKRLVRPRVRGRYSESNDWHGRFDYDPAAQNFALTTPPPGEETRFGMRPNGNNYQLALSFHPYLKVKAVSTAAKEWPKTTSVHRLETPSTIILNFVQFPESLKGGGFGQHMLRILEQACASNPKNVQAVLLEYVHFPLFNLVQQRHGWEAVNPDGTTEYGSALLKYIKFSLDGDDTEATPNRNNQFVTKLRQSFTWISPFMHAMLDMALVGESYWAETIFEQMDTFLCGRAPGSLVVQNLYDPQTFLLLELVPIAKTPRGLKLQHYLYALGNQDDRPMVLRVRSVRSERSRDPPTPLTPPITSHLKFDMWGVLLAFLVRQSQLWCRPLAILGKESDFREGFKVRGRPEVVLPSPRFREIFLSKDLFKDGAKFPQNIESDEIVQYIPRLRPKQYELIKTGVGYGVQYTRLPFAEEDYRDFDATMARFKNWNYEENRPATPDEDLWGDGNPRMTPFHSVFI